jgi:5-methylthioadenosine/S-adenosylhomocysteine deaminase
MNGFRITGARILTMNDDFEVIDGDVAVVDGRIRAVGDASAWNHLPAIAFGGDYLLPGFVQAHIHLCQTLFRHEGEGRVLLQWLRERIWPLEGAHTESTLRTSADLGIAELLLGGTTCLLDMGTVHHEEAIWEAVTAAGIRAAIGKAMMDAGEGVPGTLLETTTESIDRSVEQARAWHGAQDDLYRYAFAPRFALSCTLELQQEVGRLSREHGYLIHTHASEQLEEVYLVQALTGRRNVSLLHELGMCSHRSVFAHGVHLDETERRQLASTRTSICHCPSSNLKLGSGVADVPGLRAAGINVAIGADGSPCNNALDALYEVRLAHLLQCREKGPGSLAARDVLWMATRGGARAMDWEDRIGSIRPGLDADLVRLRRDDFRLGLDNDPYVEIVCAGHRDLVRDVWVRGRHVVQAGTLTTIDAATLRARGVEALATTMRRAGIRA